MREKRESEREMEVDRHLTLPVKLCVLMPKAGCKDYMIRLQVFFPFLTPAIWQVCADQWRGAHPCVGQ